MLVAATEKAMLSFLTPTEVCGAALPGITRASAINALEDLVQDQIAQIGDGDTDGGLTAERARAITFAQEVVYHWPTIAAALRLLRDPAIAAAVTAQGHQDTLAAVLPIMPAIPGEQHPCS